MNFAAIYHEPKGKYSFPINEHSLEIKIQVAKSDADKITIRAVDPFNWFPSKKDPAIYEFAIDTIANVEMVKKYETAYHDVWVGNVTEFVWSRINYSFVIESGEEKYLYGSNYIANLLESPNEIDNTWNYFNFPYLNKEDIFDAPKWVKDTVWYQIFPFSFAHNNDSCTAKKAGNLEGIINKLDYLQELGIGGIYFTPIFEATSNHKYDTINYFNIDPEFGTNEQFAKLVEEAHKRNIKIMLDAVFNHCGEDHPFWQDVLTNGSNSPYYNYFIIMQQDKSPSEIITIGDYEFGNYKMFGYCRTMPKWNTENPEVKRYLLDIGKFWVEKYNIDGWRLDVANEVSHEFWRTFRQEVRSINNQVYIMGEHWNYATPWLMGDQFDSVMNYRFTDPIWNFIGTSEVGKERKKEFDAPMFKEAIEKMFATYPTAVSKVMFNLLDSHDTTRICTICGDNLELTKLAYVIQLTFTGSPSIYYGGEIAMMGYEQGNSNRDFMIWDNLTDEQIDMKNFIQTLISLRKDFKTFSSENLKWLMADGNTIIYEKQFEDEKIYVIIHNDMNKNTIDLPNELANSEFRDLYNDSLVKFKDKLTLEPYQFYILQ